MDEHCGTHLPDALTHSVPPPILVSTSPDRWGDQTGEKVLLDVRWGPAAVIDVRFPADEGEPGACPFITADHVRGARGRARGARAGEVVPSWRRVGPLPPRAGRREVHARPACPRATSGRPAPLLRPLYLPARAWRVNSLASTLPSIVSAHDGVPVHHQEGLEQV